MFKRILVVGVVVAVAAAFMPAQTAEARDGYYRRGCDTCGRVVAIESAGRRDNRVGGGAVLGAIVGGALGNQVGKGDGRKAATVAGALVGGAIGNNASRRDDRYYSSVETRCRTINERVSERRIVGYDVQYRYRGDVYMSQLDYDPGERMRVRVSVTPAE